MGGAEGCSSVSVTVVLFGGVGTVQRFVQQRLVDAYWIKVYPFALGAGRPLFTDLEERARLSLVHSKAYESGILVLRYASGFRG
ncbi:dihydrofolate reductase family protein [Streptomyces lunaelactis]|uniref:dihydrofolate reductase family protein n=1 Tax=Streptomyces lunaelactis TaxID=1535768 RepID=UPI001585B4BE|nr:dihydrofolate reductase family protein [Streptomyces lunaelactis]NUK73880.1 dihydrofolate reductase family protein [Streptomyces lunaelactis]NUK79328.1 dihydrofolate reductase family protein [Streptomyces lunaelactis]